MASSRSSTTAVVTALTVVSATILALSLAGRSAEPPLPANVGPSRVEPLAPTSSDRLRSRLDAMPQLQPAVRNPFRFVPRAPTPPAAAPARPLGDLFKAVQETQAPQIELIGIAEDGAGDALVRTAIMSSAGDVLLVKEGEAVGSRYRVARIASDAAELTDTTTGLVLRLTLK
jgi:hypothetical protein